MANRIVVVEDQAELLDRITGALEARGYVVEGFEDGKVAYDALCNESPDLLITDIDLPGMSGLDLVSRLRSRHGQASLPVLVLSGQRSESDILRGYAAGANEYLTKPFSPDELLAKCAVLITRIRQEAPTLSLSDVLPTSNALTFGRYELQGTLGTGAFGTVYRAFDTESQTSVALKVLSSLQGMEPENRFRFLRECYALAAISHTNVVRVVDYGASEGRLYMAMELVEGPTLDERIRGEGPLSEREGLELLKGLASAQASLEKAGLVHRDLKPANIILRGGHANDPVVVDFGLAKQTFDRGLTEPDIMMGTPGYLPPEILQAPGFDQRGDLFALGMIGRFALGGKEAFPHLVGLPLLLRIAKGVTIPASISERLRRVLTHLVEVEPERRTQSASQLEEELAWVEEDPDWCRAATAAATAAA